MLATRYRAAALAFIRSYAHAHGDSPSLGQIAEEIGTTKPHVIRLLDRLEADGALRRLPGQPRRKRLIVLTDNQQCAVATLRALGWTINDELRIASAPLVPDRELSALADSAQTRLAALGAAYGKATQSHETGDAKAPSISAE